MQFPEKAIIMYNSQADMDLLERFAAENGLDTWVAKLKSRTWTEGRCSRMSDCAFASFGSYRSYTDAYWREFTESLPDELRFCSVQDYIAIVLGTYREECGVIDWSDIL